MPEEGRALQAIEIKKRLVDGGDDEGDEGEEGDDADDHVVDDGDDMSRFVQPIRVKLFLGRQLSGWGLGLLVT